MRVIQRETLNRAMCRLFRQLLAAITLWRICPRSNRSSPSETRIYLLAIRKKLMEVNRRTTLKILAGSLMAGATRMFASAPGFEPTNHASQVFGSLFRGPSNLPCADPHVFFSV